VVRALASHQCGAGSIPRLGEIRGAFTLPQITLRTVFQKFFVYLKADSTRSQVHVFADDTETKAVQQLFNP